jgi:hypothetical protein
MTTSIYIPRILKSLTQSKIKQIFHEKSIGMAARVDLLKVFNDSNEWIHNKAFVHLEQWYVNDAAIELKNAIDSNNGNNKLFYANNNHYWILLLNSSGNVPPEEQNDTIMSVYYVPTDHEPTDTSLACPTTIPIVDHYMDPPENAGNTYFTYYTADDYALETANDISIETLLSSQETKIYDIENPHPLTRQETNVLENSCTIDELLNLPFPEKCTLTRQTAIYSEHNDNKYKIK